MNKFVYFFKKLNSSFWFKPLIIILAGIALSVLFLYLDTITGFKPKGIYRMIFSGSSESARKVLSAIANAMIGVAGTVFSITLVVLTLATNQFGPRLLRNFMYQDMNQIVLGSYSGTYLYCLIVLNAVKGQETYTFVPNLSVLFALVLAVLNIILLILFIHHVSVSIQSSNVIENIGKIFNQTPIKIYPSGLGGDLNEENMRQHDLNSTSAIEILNKKDGYLQVIDNELLDFAKKRMWW